MKLIGSSGEVIVTWSDHYPGCEKCREGVDLEKSSTFVNACAKGSRLVMEEMQKRQAPIEAQKRREVEKWAKEAGTFIKHRVKDPRAITRYVEPTK